MPQGWECLHILVCTDSLPLAGGYGEWQTVAPANLANP